MRKKTYMFDEYTLEILEYLKKKSGKKEVQIIKEAIRAYKDNHENNEKIMGQLENLSENMRSILEMVADLSYRLGVCETMLKTFERRMRELENEGRKGTPQGN